MIKVPGHGVWFAKSALHSMQIYYEPDYPAWILTLNIGAKDGPLYLQYSTEAAAEAVAQVIADAAGAM